MLRLEVNVLFDQSHDEVLGVVRLTKIDLKKIEYILIKMKIIGCK